MRTVTSVRAGYEASNLEAATIILADAQKYGGGQSGLVVWAHLFMLRHAERQGQRVGPLFERRAA